MLQMHWKPQEDFRKDYKLRNDVLHDDISDLSVSAHTSMMSTVSPGVVASHFSLPDSRSLPTRTATNGIHIEQKTGRSRPPKDNVSQRSPDREEKFAYVCPSSCPYLLTLRGQDVHKDLVLYPLKSQTTTVGRQLDSSSSFRDDVIGLLADDVLQLHCRIDLKSLSADTSPGLPTENRRYWHHLQVDVVERAVVYVNGIRVEHTARIQPGDLLGVGDHYLFLYKDPTGGYDIPQDLPWYPGPSPLYAQVNKTSVKRRRKERGESGEQHALVSDAKEKGLVNQHGFLFDGPIETARPEDDGSLTVPYPLGREKEVLEHIVNISCCSPSQFPHTTTVLLLGCYGYASRRLPPAHLSEFFRTLTTVIRNRVSVVSKTLSTQKYHTTVYTAVEDNLTDDSRDGDPLLELLCWLSNAVRMYSHVTSAEFHLQSGRSVAADVTESVTVLCDGLREMVDFMFQQTVYCITKVLFGHVTQILTLSSTPSAADNARAVSAMEQVLHVLRVTLDLSQDVSLHRDVMIQLLIYLVFFVTTTLFNRLITKGSGARQLCWSVGAGLQSCVTSLENWVSSVGLEARYIRVAQPLVSLVDLLATPTNALLRMDWSGFKSQFSALSEAQLIKVLSGYHFTDGHTPPASWFPPSGLQPSEDVTIDLTSHPSFVLPQHGTGVDLKDIFPPSLYRHLDGIISLFPLFGTDVNDGNRNLPVEKQQRPDLSLPISPQATFFSSFSSPSNSHSHNQGFPHHSPIAPPTPPREQRTSEEQNLQSPPLPHRHRDQDDDVPPPLPPRLPPRSPVTPSKTSVKSPLDSKGTDSPSPRCPQQGGGGVSSREPFSGVLGSASPMSANDKSHTDTLANVSIADNRQGNGNKKHDRQDDVTRERSVQNGKTPRYTLLPSKYNPNNQSVRNQDRPHLGSQPSGTVVSNSEQQFYPKTCNSEGTGYNLSGQDSRNQGYPPASESPGVHTDISEQAHSTLKREPPPYHKLITPHNKHFSEEQQNPSQIKDLRFPLELKARDPRRRPLNGTLLSSGSLTLQDKRILNRVPSLEIPSENVSIISDSAVSDDVFVQSSTDLPPWNLGPSVQASELRRFSTGMLSQERSDTETEDRPLVVKVDMYRGSDRDGLTVDRCLDDIYIDVVKEMGLTVGNASRLKVLPQDDGVISHHTLPKDFTFERGQQGVAEDAPRVRYRHKMLHDKDSSTKGELTGEVFTLTLIKEGSKLGMGLIDGMHTALKLPGIYVRNVLPGTPAALCGHIRVGDRILAVNGRSIVGADYASAMKLIRSTGPRLNLLIAKCDRSVTAGISAS